MSIQDLMECSLGSGKDTEAPHLELSIKRRNKEGVKVETVCALAALPRFV